VPNVPPPQAPSRPVWNSGQVMQQAQSPGQFNQAPYNQVPYNQAPYGQPSPYGQPGGFQSPFGGGGSSFLGTAAATAAGMVGGSLLLNSIRGMMGGSHQAFGDTAGLGDRAVSQSPLSDQSGSNLAHDAGVGDIGSSGGRADDNSRTGLLDTASKDDDSSSTDYGDDHDADDHDDMDLDSDDLGGDNDSDYA
jgi:uncharacterized protein